MFRLIQNYRQVWLLTSCSVHLENQLHLSIRLKRTLNLVLSPLEDQMNVRCILAGLLTVYLQHSLEVGEVMRKLVGLSFRKIGFQNLSNNWIKNLDKYAQNCLNL